MSVFVYSHNPNSEGAKELTRALGIRKIKHENSRFKGGLKHTVINWGSGNLPPVIETSRVINPAARVASAANKLSFFRLFKDSQIVPAWTESFDQATAWLGEGHDVCARTVLNGHSAAGLVIMTKNNPAGFVKAPLYTKYVKKVGEFRVHVAFGNVIDVQKKVLSEEKKASGDAINWQVRNLDNGFIFQRNNINTPASVTNVATEAMRISGLDFGAVDVVYNGKEEKAYVLEINTAPGLQGTTIDNYANAFRGLL